MKASLSIPQTGALDFLSLGAVVHRLDPGIVPFRKAHECQIHVSGGEFNVAANLADCFRLNTGVATAMVRYPIGELVAERILRYARLVGRENVIAGVDCGFAQGLATARVHPSIMWEKFRMLAEGARLATRRLW